LDFQLIAVLREVKYLETAQNETLETIPESATAIYSRNETFHKFCANLDLTVAWYNQVRETLLDVEFPLVEGQLQNIDNQLEQAEKSLNWNSDGKQTCLCFCSVLYSTFGKKDLFCATAWVLTTTKCLPTSTTLGNNVGGF
jgi:hypothetical protein